MRKAFKKVIMYALYTLLNRSCFKTMVIETVHYEWFRDET